MESLRQDLSEKQSLLSEAGEAIEQLENKIKLQDDLNKKVKGMFSSMNQDIRDSFFIPYIRTFLSLNWIKLLRENSIMSICRVITVTRTSGMLRRTVQELRTMSLKISTLTTLTR